MDNDIDPLHSFSQLPAEVDTALRKALHVRTVSAGEAIFQQGDSPYAVYLVAGGRVKIVRSAPQDYESILCVRGPGEYFCPVPLLDGDTQLGSAYAITDVTLFWVERETFQRLCEQSSELLALVQGDCLAEVRNLLHRLEAFAFRSVRERVGIVLLEETCCQPPDDQPSNRLDLTQEEIAGLIGASRESVSRNLRALEEEGILELGRGRVIIQDRERLSDFVDDL